MGVRAGLKLAPTIMDILDYKEQITKIYLVRHGETRANKLRLLFGHLDLDLNQNGIKQARKTAKKLVRVGLAPTHIISSPLKRAKHTAKIIAKHLVGAGLTRTQKIIIDKDLLEKSEGTWEGKTFWEVRKEDSKNYKKWIKNPIKNRPPKGESISDLNKRAKKFYKTILRKYLGENIIVVSHSGPIRLFILNILGADINKFWHLQPDCGSITEVHVSKKHSMICGFNL